MIVQVHGLEKSFARTQVLRGVNLTVNQGEHCVISGASGSGKSTLLHLLGGLDRANAGSIEVCGLQLSQLGDEDLAKYRNRLIGFVFQFHYLLPSMNALENILLPARIGNLLNKELKQRVQRMAELLDVGPFLKKYPYQLSGGEQQRINIIRALSMGPELLLCDEPTGNLDSVNSQKVMDLLKSMAETFKATLLVVTHDKNIALQFQRQLNMADGLLS